MASACLASDGLSIRPLRWSQEFTGHISCGEVGARLAEVDAREGGHGVVHLVQQLARAQVGVADEAAGQRGQQARPRAAAKAVAAAAAQVGEGAPLQPPYPAPLRHLRHSGKSSCLAGGSASALSCTTCCDPLR